MGQSISGKRSGCESEVAVEQAWSPLMAGASSTVRPVLAELTLVTITAWQQRLRHAGACLGAEQW
ncbi:hypothetical protein GCM10020220_062940 [Nonomuraea rubra]